MFIIFRDRVIWCIIFFDWRNFILVFGVLYLVFYICIDMCIVIIYVIIRIIKYVLVL